MHLDVHVDQSLTVNEALACPRLSCCVQVTWPKECLVHYLPATVPADLESMLHSFLVCKPLQLKLFFCGVLQ